MRAVWDAAAATGSDRMLGRPNAAREQLERLFGDLGAEARGDGTCVEVGCGAGRMTTELAERWPRVVATDVSPAMVERARERVQAPNVEFVVTGGRLEGVAAASADTVVCFGVLQHLPTRHDLAAMLADVARVLRPDGHAFVQLPVLHGTLRARAWRSVRSATTRLRRRGGIEDAPEYRGTRVTERELAHIVEQARLRVVARVAVEDATLYSTYPHADDVRLRLARA